MNEKRYIAVTQYIQSRPFLDWLVKICYYLLPYLVGAVYFAVIIYLIAVDALEGRTYSRLLFAVFGPFTAFAVTSLYRKFCNAQRPYERYEYMPLIARNKAGEFFPSRHAVSAAAIATACICVSVPLSVVLGVAALIIAVTRVIAGVHFIKDVTAGIIAGFGIVWIMFYLILP